MNTVILHGLKFPFKLMKDTFKALKSSRKIQTVGRCSLNAKFQLIQLSAFSNFWVIGYYFWNNQKVRYTFLSNCNVQKSLYFDLWIFSKLL